MSFDKETPEAAVASVVPPAEQGGHLLVLDNGAYCKRVGRLAMLMAGTR